MHYLLVWNVWRIVLNTSFFGKRQQWGDKYHILHDITTFDIAVHTYTTAHMFV